MENITPLAFWLGIITVALPQIISLLSKWRETETQRSMAKEQVKAEEEKIKQTIIPQMQTDAWERLIKQYQSQLEAMGLLQGENNELRKLPLQLVLKEEEMKQCKDDKEDWKRYANQLYEQVKELGQIPLPFRRTPSDGDTQEKIATISRERLDAINKQVEEAGTNGKEIVK
ncbi:MAG: hypothetical protein ABIO63_02715 [Casimicrobiaceae bacterium]